MKSNQVWRNIHALGAPGDLAHTEQIVRGNANHAAAWLRTRPIINALVVNPDGHLTKVTAR